MRVASSQPSDVRVFKASAWLAVVFFLLGVCFTPDYGSSLGMPWWLFFCTWGTMSVSAFFSILGYIGFMIRGDRISIFYLVCPLLLFAVLLFVYHRYEIIRDILRYEGIA